MGKITTTIKVDMNTNNLEVKKLLGMCLPTVQVQVSDEYATVIRLVMDQEKHLDLYVYPENIFHDDDSIETIYHVKIRQS